MPTRIDSTGPESAKTRAGKARPEGLIGVFATLAEQHNQLAELLAQLQRSPEQRATLWPAVRRELVSHEHSEVRELYPLLRQLEVTRGFADHHDDEARELDALIARLDMLDPSSAAWEQVLDTLIPTVLHHAKEEEEQKIFPVAQRALGEARSIELDAKVLAVKQQLATME